MSISVTIGRVTLMQYNTLTNMIAFTVVPDEISPSKDTDFLLAHDMFNIAQFLENAMRNNYTVMVEHEEGQTYVAAVGSAA
ncbi:hypothetical protein [Enterobacter sp. C2]|uniref:hypothetical protein n=1 Tax=Enterobacter sp. C2 TaxID=2870346 RepID=UPI001CA406B3|nr:hypothetical protein [Enterobacter sp. C2]